MTLLDPSIQISFCIRGSFRVGILTGLVYPLTIGSERHPLPGLNVSDMKIGDLTFNKLLSRF